MANTAFDRKKIDRYFKSEFSDNYTSYINDVFCDNTKEEELKLVLSEQFNDLLTENELNSKNLDHILHRIHYEINTKGSISKTWSFDHIAKWTLRIAGVIILPLAILTGIHNYNEGLLEKETWVEIKAPAWTKAQFSLPDGTKGWLNSSSSVKYNGNFNTDRQVLLSGEAFFDVFKDKTRPFIVNTNEVSVKALGTRFNITSYDNENTVEVVLEEGKLLFNNKEMNKTVTMNPNDLVTYDKDLKDYSTEVVQPQKYLSWTEGKLEFRNDPLDIIARKLERRYDADVEVDISSTEDIRWRATFINEDLEEVLMYMKRSLPVDFKIENSNLKQDGTYIKKKVIITLSQK